MADLVRAQVAQLQAMILAKFPDTKFKLEPSDKEDIWHFAVYTPEGRMHIPLEVTDNLNKLWRERRISIITTVYPLALYQEEP